MSDYSDSEDDELHFFDTYDEENGGIPQSLLKSSITAPGCIESRRVQFSSFHIRSSLKRVPDTMQKRLDMKTSVHEQGINQYKTKQLLHRTKSVRRESLDPREEERRLRRERKRLRKEERRLHREANPEAFAKGLLRLEFLTEWEFKVMFLIITVTFIIAVSMAILSLMGTQRWELPTNEFSMQLLVLICLFIGCAVWIINVTFFSLLIERIYKTRHNQFTPLQWRTVIASLIGMLLSLLVTSSYLAQYAMATISSDKCPFLTPEIAVFTNIRWALIVILYFFINTLAIDHIVGPDGDIVNPYWWRDGWKNARYYFYLQLPNLVICTSALVLILLQMSETLYTTNEQWDEVCKNYDLSLKGQPCLYTNLPQEDEEYLTVAILWCLMFFFFFVYIFIAWYRLTHKPWRKYATTNIGLRLLMLQTIPIAFCAVVIKILRIEDLPADRCGNTHDEVHIKSPELILLLSVWAAIRCYTAAPILDYEYRRQIRYMVLQNFLWVEPDFKAIDTQSFWAESIGTNEHNRDYCNYGANETLGAQPVFSFETMVKMLFWSELTYMEEKGNEGLARGTLGNASDVKRSLSIDENEDNIKKKPKEKKTKKTEWGWSVFRPSVTSEQLHAQGSPDVENVIASQKDANPNEITVNPARPQTQLREVSSGTTTDLRRSLFGRSEMSLGTAPTQDTTGLRSRRRRGTTFESEWNENMNAYSEKTTMGFSRALVIAMSNYNLEFYKVFHEETSQTKVIVAWSSDGQMVVSFRGTVYLPNMLNDVLCLQTLWRSMVPAAKAASKSKCQYLFNKPKIHHGFKRAMASENVGSDLITFICFLVHDMVKKRVRPCLRITGHSLGGALATLMAYEVMVRCKDVQLSSQEVTVYTFGCPGLCNTVSKKLYENAIPSIFHVVNDVDFIAHCGPWLRFFKPGILVLINKYGDLIVRPSLIEGSLHHIWFQEKLADHFLSAYRSSCAKICESDPECSKETIEVILEANPLMRSEFKEKNLEGLKPSRFQHLAFITNNTLGRAAAKPFKVVGAGVMSIGFRGGSPIKRIKPSLRRSTVLEGDREPKTHFWGDDGGWEGDIEDNEGGSENGEGEEEIEIKIIV